MKKLKREINVLSTNCNYPTIMTLFSR